MSNFLLYRNRFKEQLNKSEIENALNLAGNFSVNLFKEDCNIFGSAHLESAPLKGKRFFKNDRWIVLFAGDLIDYETVPFSLLINTVENEQWGEFEKLNGVFAISFFDKLKQCFYLVSDRRSQHPVYYFINEDELIFSTELSLFVKLLNSPEFEEKWLYNYLFFNFTIGQTTFLKNVYKMPSSSILKYNCQENKIQIIEYTQLFQVKEPLFEGIDALEYAKDIFAKQLPKYYPEKSQIACALTNGWDGRTVLALAPSYENVTAYTYGGIDCKDILNAKKTAKLLKIPHKEIHFDDDYLSQLHNDIFEAVYLSSGHQGILRSTLVHVYKTLSQKFGFNLALSGILLDGLFRGNGGYPGVIPEELHELFTNTSLQFRKIWEEMFEQKTKNFKSEILNTLNSLKEKFGDFNSTVHHLHSEVYNNGPGHFGGEWMIANNFITIRVPAWDNEITKIAYSVKESKLSYSQYTSSKFGSKESMMLQAYLINNLSPEFAKIPIRLTKPNVVLRNNTIYNIYAIYRKISFKLEKTRYSYRQTYLENWNYWINNNLRNQIDDLIFSKDSLIRNYISTQFLQKLYIERQYKWIGKLVTVEIILKLIKNKWQRFW